MKRLKKQNKFYGAVMNGDDFISIFINPDFNDIRDAKKRRRKYYKRNN